MTRPRGSQTSAGRRTADGLLCIVGLFLMADNAATWCVRAETPVGALLLLRMLHSCPITVIASPVAAPIVDVGELYALYPTGLYRAMAKNDVPHAPVHLHTFLAGCLVSWLVVGIVPIQRRGARVNSITVPA